MSRVREGLCTLLLSLAPSGVTAQCAIDMIESGVQAYRDLELETAQQLLESALDVNGSTSSRCGTQNARALTYLGATHWLLQRSDSAWSVFERAVIQAPRFRPDEVEFPPDITSLFDRVRRSTPSIAVALPDEVEIGPQGAETLFVRVTASTGHWITVTLRSHDGDPVRTLYRGPIVTGAQGAVVEWDGRDFTGDPVRSGAYTLEIVSADSLSWPVRKVMVPLTVESDAPVEARTMRPVDSVAPPQVRMPARGGGGVWSGVATAGAGLVAGAAIVVLPLAVDGFPARWERYPVAVSLGVAGIVGLVQRLRRGEPEPEPLRDPRPIPAAGFLDPPPAPTLRIRAGLERRVELDHEWTGSGRPNRDASVRSER